MLRAPRACYAKRHGPITAGHQRGFDKHLPEKEQGSCGEPDGTIDSWTWGRETLRLVIQASTEHAHSQRRRRDDADPQNCKEPAGFGRARGN